MRGHGECATEGVGFIGGWLLGPIGAGKDIQTLPSISAEKRQHRLLFTLTVVNGGIVDEWEVVSFVGSCKDLSCLRKDTPLQRESSRFGSVVGMNATVR